MKKSKYVHKVEKGRVITNFINHEGHRAVIATSSDNYGKIYHLPGGGIYSDFQTAVKKARVIFARGGYKFGSV